MAKSYKSRQAATTQESCGNATIVPSRGDATSVPSLEQATSVPCRGYATPVPTLDNRSVSLTFRAGTAPHVNDRSLPSRLKAKLGAQAGAAAVDYLSDVVTGAAEASPKLRVEAAKTVLDRVGVIAPRAEHQAIAGAEDLSAMSAAELRRFVVSGLEELASRAKPAEIPAPSPAQVVDIFD